MPDIRRSRRQPDHRRRALALLAADGCMEAVTDGEHSVAFKTESKINALEDNSSVEDHGHPDPHFQSAAL